MNLSHPMFDEHRSGTSDVWLSQLRYKKKILPRLKSGMVVKMWFPGLNMVSHIYHNHLAELEYRWPDKTSASWAARIVTGRMSGATKILYYSEFVLISPLELLAGCADGSENLSD